MKINPSKTYKTRGGLKVIIITTNSKILKGYPITGDLFLVDGTFKRSSWRSTGRVISGIAVHAHDIVSEWNYSKDEDVHKIKSCGSGGGGGGFVGYMPCKQHVPPSVVLTFLNEKPKKAVITKEMIREALFISFGYKKDLADLFIHKLEKIRGSYIKGK